MAEIKEKAQEVVSTVSEKGKSALGAAENTTRTTTSRAAGWVKSHGKGVGGALVALLLIGGLIWWLASRNGNDDSQANIDEIRNAFPNLSQNNQGATSTGDSFFFGGSSTSTPATTTPQTATRSPISGPGDETPRGGQNRVAGTNTQAPHSQIPTVYKSPLGFTVTLPAGWATDQAQNSWNRNLFFDGNTGRMIGYITVYQQNGETLDSLEQLIKASPDTANTSRILVNNTPAISYTKHDGSRSVAILRGNSIYYIHDEMTSVLSSWEFK